jgi:hypothetical protein
VKVNSCPFSAAMGELRSMMCTSDPSVSICLDGGTARRRYRTPQQKRYCEHHGTRSWMLLSRAQQGYDWPSACWQTQLAHRA